MYQSATAPVSATRPARPQFRLAGRLVTQDMFYAAQNAKRAGRRCLLVTAGESEISRFDLAEEDCPNCGGFGHLSLEVVMGGPFRNAPAGRQGSEDENPSVHLRPAWHNGAWWTVVRDLYQCPVCKTDREIIL